MLPNVGSDARIIGLENQNMKSQYAWSLIALLIFGTALWAKDGADNPKKTPAGKFAKMDQDGDGSLSQDEFKAPKLNRMAKKFGDTPDATEKLQRTESKEVKRFTKADTDGDGLLSLEEYSEYQTMMAEKKAAKKANKDAAE
jgi:hypothetical protein